ncbi:MAG: 4-hydroxy-tetrahydrodipicolinate reductase [Oscillospiraceae bacterium]|nr:4-hydroxy-tetrahydrodipicolinate reductase [Oscillospiraceae bacterium]
MTRVILSGCSGKMGKVVASVIREREDCIVVAGLDLVKEPNSPFPVFAKPEEISIEADVIVDFSHISVLEPLLAYAKAKGIPTVLATTGYSDSQVKGIHQAAEHIPVFYTRNMSLGINLMASLAQKAAAVLGGSFDIEIVERHHNQKIDAPSGTALLLADAINEELDHRYKYEFDRHSQRKKRDKNEIGLHAIRGGTIVGEHDVIFAGHDEVMTLSHAAYSKEVFAAGAVNAAVFMAGKSEARLYDMADLVG